MGISSGKNQYRRERRKKMLQIRIVGLASSVVAVFITGILVGQFVAGKNDPDAGKKKPKFQETAVEEVADTEVEKEVALEQAEEAIGHKLPRENDYVFHEESVNNGNFYAIETPDAVDLSEDATLGSSHAVLINADDWTIVAYKGPYDRIVPASMTKVLTVLTAAEAIPEEKLNEQTSIDLTISDYCYENDCSAAGIAPGEMVTVKDLFYCTILPSGADGALGLAKYVSGSQDEFMNLMNQKLADLNLSSSAHFTNCIGLYGEDHYCTVYDMAMIMAAALQNDFVKEVLTTHQYTTSSTDQNPSGIELSNLFLRRIEDLEFGGTIQGAKTGYVTQSGNCAVSSEVSDKGTTYICVTVGAEGGWNCIYDHQYLYQTYATE